MRYSQSLIKTNKSAKEMEAINATLLTKGGFVDQTMAGVYTFLPLGWRVLKKIEDIVRAEMDKLGSEMFMPALSPKEIWETTGRLESVDVLMGAKPANELSEERNNADYILNCTHEDLLESIVAKLKTSYKDFPFAVYQIQTKFRNEERPKSGILRGREFRMKDLYSFHTSDEDRKDFYENVKKSYLAIFEKLGLGDDTVVVQASGGDFTDDFSHEFQTKLENGEDTVYYDKENDAYLNAEIASDEMKEKAESFKASEVGNIFPLGTKFADAFNHKFTDENGEQKPVWMASYGIGTSRVMGVIAEKFNDNKGLMWPKQVAPFTVHLAALNLDNESIKAKADALYEELQQNGIDVLYDDRLKASPGEKFSDADLIGCPWRVVVSAKTEDQVEVKARTEDKEQLMSKDSVITLITAS